MAESQQNLNNSMQPTNLNPPITMTVDAPSEETNETGAELQNLENHKICSPVTEAKASTSQENCLASTDNSSCNSRSILKPPQLSFKKSNNSKNSNTPSKPLFFLNPSRLNPLVKSKAEEANASEKKNVQINGETPKFVPLVQSDNKSNSQSATVTTSATNVTSTPAFVFGQNLQERVVTAAENKADEPKACTSLNTNGTTEMLFSSAIKNDVKTDSSGGNKETKSLRESAREYEESRANKRKYDEVEVKTGEEGETNILNITCKLFAFDKVAGWQERGRGTLRLNDLAVEDGNTQSRLVFRTTGSLRVVLNTKIWAEMTIEQASERGVRFTALDANGEIKVFLAMATIDDSKQLCSQIKSRVQKEVQKHKKIHADSGGN